MYLLFKKAMARESAVFVACCMIGGLFFISVFGTGILDFTYTDWLMQGGDLSQHYLGWEFFRDSKWSFPIGLIDCLLYPYKESVIYTDSIPLFAIFFKLLAPVLPARFQYFGLYGLLAYMLQGGFAGIIIRRLANDPLAGILGSIFFILSSTMAWRIYAHTSLAAHFIILACIYYCISKAAIRPIRTNVMVWGGLLVLAVSIHMYFVPMVGIFMCFDLMDDFLETKKPAKQLTELALSIAPFAAMLFLLGGFYTKLTKNAGGGLGLFGTNLNSLFNPSGMSAFLKDLPLAKAHQYEGNAYLGFGMVLCIALSVAAVSNNFARYKSLLADKAIFRRFLLTVGLVFAFWAIALSPVVTFNGKTLFSYLHPIFQDSDLLREYSLSKILGAYSPVHWPLIFSQLAWSVFRASGRLIWPVAYVIMFSAVWIVVKEYKRKTALLALAILVAIQYKDLSAYFSEKGRPFAVRAEWETNLTSPAWDMLATEYRHIFFVGDHQNLYPVSKYAADNQMTLNDFYFARKDLHTINQNKENELAAIRQGNASEDTIYIFSQVPPSDDSIRQKLYFYNIDGMTIGLKSRMEAVEAPAKMP